MKALLMETNYYNILNIPENSTLAEISEAYKIFATKSHPQNSYEDIEHLPGLSKSKIWQLVNEAYDVFNNPEVKKIYDNYGIEGLTAGTSYSKPYVYQGDPMKTYNDVFGFSTPKRKDEALEIDLPLDIREIYHGTVKVVQMFRRNYDENGSEIVLQEHRLIIPVQAGTLAGTKYLFREEGDQRPTSIPADVVFKVEDVEDAIFRREGADIHMKHPVDLSDALCGFKEPLVIRTLDDRQFSIMITDIVGPSYMKRIPNEGLPFQRDSSKKGDLYIHFNIIFPTHIPLSTKKELRKLLDKLPL